MEKLIGKISLVYRYKNSSIGYGFVEYRNPKNNNEILHSKFYINENNNGNNIYLNDVVSFTLDYNDNQITVCNIKVLNKVRYLYF